MRVDEGAHTLVKSSQSETQLASCFISKNKIKSFNKINSSGQMTSRNGIFHSRYRHVFIESVVVGLRLL